MEPEKDICKVVIPIYPVPKGPTYICVVWNFTKNGVNNTIFVPSFFPSTNATLLQKVVNGTHMEYFDIGERFHNCLLRLCKHNFRHIYDTLMIQYGVDGLSRDEILLGQLQTPIE